MTSVALVAVSFIMAAACLGLASYFYQRSRAVEFMLVRSQAELRKADDALREFQYEQMELILKIKEHADDDLSDQDIAYVYRSLGVRPPQHVVDAEAQRDRALTSIIDDLDAQGEREAS